MHPAVDYRDALPVAGVGFVVNIVSALLLSHHHHYGPAHDGGHDHGADRSDGRPAPGTIDFNLRAAYIHIIADALTSLVAIGALSLAWWAGRWFLDPLTGVVGGAVIAWWAVGLCRQASHQLLDVVCSRHHEQVVRSRREAIDDVRVVDLHVWSSVDAPAEAPVDAPADAVIEVSHHGQH